MVWVAAEGIAADSDAGVTARRAISRHLFIKVNVTPTCTCVQVCTHTLVPTQSVQWLCLHSRAARGVMITWSDILYVHEAAECEERVLDYPSLRTPIKLNVRYSACRLIGRRWHYVVLRRASVSQMQAACVTFGDPGIKRWPSTTPSVVADLR